MIIAEEFAACTGARMAAAGAWLAPIQEVMDKCRINSPTRMAAFLAQAGHESAHFQCLRENLNYTPEALLKTFNQKVCRFTKTDAYRYGRTAEHPADQQAIANIAYGGRIGNGPMESGDGWRYRGGGPAQLTGRASYSRCGAAIGVDIQENPELIETPKIGAMALGWFWDCGNSSGRSLNTLADAGDIDAISRAINGGTIGMTERRIAYQHNLQILRG